MRTLFVFHTHRVSGAEVVIKRAIGILAKRGVEPHVCAPRGEVIPFFDEVAAGAVEVEGVYPPRLGAVAKLVRFARDRRIELLWANSPKSAPITAVASKLRGIPSVWAVHDIARLTARNKLFFRSMATAFSRVVAVSAATRKRLVELGVPGAKVVVARPGIDIDSWRAAANNGQRVALESPSILMVGAMTRWKGQHVFLEAAKALIERGIRANFYLVGDIIDDGDIPYKEWILKMASDPLLGGKVHYLGKRSDVAALIAASDIVVHASCEPDPFPTVVTESLVLGKAVVASRVGGTPEQIDDGRTGLLFEPGDPLDLALKISKLLANAELRESIGMRAMESSDRFRLELFADVICGVLSEACGQLLPDL